jgi:hypothetical protein
MRQLWLLLVTDGLGNEVRYQTIYAEAGNSRQTMRIYFIESPGRTVLFEVTTRNPKAMLTDVSIKVLLHDGNMKSINQELVEWSAVASGALPIIAHRAWMAYTELRRKWV